MDLDTRLELQARLLQAKQSLDTAINVFDDIAEDDSVPEDIRDKVSRISSALGIDLNEVDRIKSLTKEHD